MCTWLHPQRHDRLAVINGVRADHATSLHCDCDVTLFNNITNKHSCHKILVTQNLQYACLHSGAWHDVLDAYGHWAMYYWGVTVQIYWGVPFIRAELCFSRYGTNAIGTWPGPQRSWARANTGLSHCGYRSHKRTSVGKEEGVRLSDQPFLHSYLIL